MSWTRTNRHHRALRRVEAELDLAADDAVPWRTGFAEIFGTRDGLRLALATRWRLITETQGDDLTMAELVGAHPGLARLVGLHRHDLVQLRVAS